MRDNNFFGIPSALPLRAAGKLGRGAERPCIMLLWYNRTIVRNVHVQ